MSISDDPSRGDGERHHRERGLAAEDHEARRPVDQRGSRTIRQAAEAEGPLRDCLTTTQDPRDVRRQGAGIRSHHDIRVQHLQQRFEVAAP